MEGRPRRDATRHSPRAGRFGTSGLDLAAAFGPVTGVKGDILFTDLLALASAPDQVATVASINPGVPVTDGTGAVVAAINVSMRVGFGSGDVEQPDRRVVPALQRCAAALSADVVASGRSGFPS